MKCSTRKTRNLPISLIPRHCTLIKSSILAAGHARNCLPESITPCITEWLLFGVRVPERIKRVVAGCDIMCELFTSKWKIVLTF